MSTMNQTRRRAGERVGSSRHDPAARARRGEEVAMGRSASKNRCPRCRRNTLRVMVDLFIDIPASMQHNVSKTKLRSRAVRVDGARWECATTYCGHPSCGYGSRGPMQVRVEETKP